MVYWHCGDEEGNIPPMKYFETSDVKFLSRARKKLSEIRRVMRFLDTAATSAGLAPKEHHIYLTLSHGGKCLLQPQPACT